MYSQKIIAQVLDSEQLAALSGRVVPPPAVRLAESLPISADERLVWEHRLNRYLNSCGCAEGAVGLFLGVSAAIITYFAQSEPWPAWEIATAITLPIALLIGGKTVGRWLNRLRFRKVCKRLLSRLAINIIEENHHG